MFDREGDTAVSRADISLAGAARAIDAAIAAAEAHGVQVCIAVCDAAGHSVASARMDGAPLLSMQIAADKAWSVAAFNGLPTSRWWSLIQDDPALVHGITQTPRLVVFGGGEPVHVDGRLVGAVGISGGSAEQDVAVAIAAASSLG
jgi:glc operon protein GlcG